MFRLQRKISKFFDELIEKWHSLNKEIFDHYGYPVKYTTMDILDEVICEYINDDVNEYNKILKKYNIKFISVGAVRAAFSIKYYSKEYCFKVQVGVDNMCKNEHRREISLFNQNKKSPYIRSLVLPVLHYFYHKKVKFISIFPKIDKIFEDIKHVWIKKEKDLLKKNYNKQRMEFFNYLTGDAHEANIGYWKGYFWLIDYAEDEDYCDYPRCKKKYIEFLRINSKFNLHHKKVLDIVDKELP